MIDLVVNARNQAFRWHKDQYRDDGLTPYFFHLQEVAQLVEKNGGTPEMIAAAYLHDSREDQNISDLILDKYFGPTVTYYVNRLTNEPVPPFKRGSPDNEHPRNADARRKRDNDRIAGSPGEVIIIKLCDRINNLSDLHSFDVKRRGKFYDKTLDLIKKIESAGHWTMSAFYPTIVALVGETKQLCALGAEEINELSKNAII